MIYLTGVVYRTNSAHNTECHQPLTSCTFIRQTC